MAVALSYIDLPLDPTYAKIVFFRSEWGYTEDKEFFYKRTELESHVCSEEELGLSGEAPRFMPIHKSQYRTLNDYKERFVCINDEDLFIENEYSSEEGKSLVIEYYRCDPSERDCQPEEEIDNFFKGKELLLLSNSIRFDQL